MVWLVQNLIDDGNVEPSMCPIDAVVGEKEKPEIHMSKSGETRNEYKHSHDYTCEEVPQTVGSRPVIELAIPHYLGLEPRERQ